jgi:CheY-like chemotaxis protein
METRHKILLLDDDVRFLETYQAILVGLPSKPEVRIAASGARALAMLESDSYRLIICDLKMPKMDGLQVLSIVRRKFPNLRTVVLTSVMDEQFRSRAYALGVDLFWEKPTSKSEIKMFLDCLESLLGREDEQGFRGVQSKSLVDLIQLECISQSSSVLRITNGPLTGRIWINSGDVIDAETETLTGEEAFSKILSWKTGNFESLPPEQAHPRHITKSYNALLLESAQAIDEAIEDAKTSDTGITTQTGEQRSLSALAKVEGVEFVLALLAGPNNLHESRGLENPDRMAAWTRNSLASFHALGEKLQAGNIEEIEGLGPQRHVALARQGQVEFCLGWQLSLSPETIRQQTRKAIALWVS